MQSFVRGRSVRGSLRLPEAALSRWNEGWAAASSALDHRVVRRALAIFPDRSLLLTTLAVLGVACGLIIAALLSRDPREAGAYAVACIMIGGAIALGLRHTEHDPVLSEATLAAVREEAQQEARQEAQQHMRAVAHDLKAPLLTVTSYLELIADGAFGALPEEARAALHRAAEVSTRAQSVVDSTLHRDTTPDAALAPVALLEAEPAVTRVNLDRVLSDVMAALNASMRARGATVSVEGRLSTVLGDEPSLFRVIENLVQNAIKFCPADTTPRIAIRSSVLQSGAVEMIITDNGPGMPSDPTLLATSGVRGVNADGLPGHGLGLATVARLVARLGGTLTFESPTTGGGTTVRIVLRGG